MGNDSSRAVVFGATFGVMAAFVASVILLQPWLSARLSLSAAVSAGVAFAVVQGGAAIVLLVCAAASKVVKQRRAASAAEAAPKLREKLAAFCVGEGPTVEELARDRRSHARAFEEALLELLRVTQGGVRARLREAVEGSGLGAAWRRQARSRRTGARRRALECLALVADPADAPLFGEALRSSAAEVRMQALRCEIAIGRPEDIELAFAASLREPLLLRALVAQELRKHCAVLAQGAIPRILREGGAEEVVAALEFVAAWGRALPVEGAAGLCGHDDVRVRVAALRALGVLLPTDTGRAAVVRALSQGGPEEKRAAAAAAASMGMIEAEAPLLGVVRSAPFAVALPAALAICRLGPAARDRLEGELGSLAGHSAAAVVEAVDVFRTGRATRAGDA